MRRILASITLATTIGCSNKTTGRYQPVGEARDLDSLGPVMIAIDTRTGRLCYAITALATESAKANVPKGGFCDESLRK